MMKSTENQRTKKKEEVWYDERGERHVSSVAIGGVLERAKGLRQI